MGSRFPMERSNFGGDVPAVVKYGYCTSLRYACSVRATEHLQLSSLGAVHLAHTADESISCQDSSSTAQITM